jgi:dihydrofolate synthase/folylpolyglutamate synthase
LDRENSPDGLTGLSTPLVGAHQASNATRVISLLLEMKKNSRDFSFADSGAIRRGLAATDWPGRMEAIRDPSGKTIILDGAHNAHAARALVSSLGSVAGEDGPLSVGAIVFAVMRDKDIPPILGILRELNCPMYCSELPMERSCKAADLADLARAEKITVAGAPRDPSEALRAALASVRENEAVLCCGSLFLVGHLRKFLKYGL